MRANHGEPPLLLQAQNLTRRYGSHVAVDGLSFELQRGEVVGLLGPNGAGKTTTMRMLSCFLPPSAGTALVAGHDLLESPTAVRQHLGYMPEDNPLYAEMRVEEYLAFRARLKGVVRKRRRRRISTCMELCGTADVRRQIIGTLSKGYRQRVGLADALLGDPEVLILDEPTIGLDPNQIRQTRRTIAGLSDEHTILLSTHILQEVEAVCQRALIIDNGRIVADDSVENLAVDGARRRIVAEIDGEPDEVRRALQQLKGARRIEVDVDDSWCICRMTPAENADPREQIFHLASERGWTLRELRAERTRLEDVFHKLTRGENP